MEMNKPTADLGINWPVVALGGLLLAVAVVAADTAIMRIIAAVLILAATIYMSRTREEPIVENPLLDQLRDQRQGLDRRKYGKLRQTTDRLLDYVRRMNRIAIDGREGKLSPRHAHAEMDRLAALMRDQIDEIRKSAGIPTPMEDADKASKVVQPKIVFPKGQQPAPGAKKKAAAAPAAAEPPAPRDDTDRMLDELEAQAEADASKGGDLDAPLRPTTPPDEG